MAWRCTSKASFLSPQLLQVEVEEPILVTGDYVNKSSRSLFVRRLNMVQ